MHFYICRKGISVPRVSIIVPVYNVEKYINRCIDSILSQTFTDFELILVDDGSPDKSGEICDEYAKKDKRIKVIHKKNGGLSDARNVGLEIAKGDFIGFVDSDDYIELDMYEKLLEACEENNSRIAMCGRFNVFGEVIEPFFSFSGYKIWKSKEAIENLLTWDNIDSSSCDKLFNRELFRDIRFPVGKYNEDIYVMTRIIHNSGKVVHIGEAKYYYYHRPNSITTELFSEKKLDLLEANYEVVKLVNDYYPELKLKADSFQLKGIIYLSGLLQDKNYKNLYSNSYKLIMKNLYLNLFKIIYNPYIDKEMKMKAIIMATKLYAPIKNIKRIFSINKI